MTNPQKYTTLGLYNDPSDPRAFVPKRSPALGWTVNMGHPGGRITLAVIAGTLVAALAMNAVR